MNARFARLLGGLPEADFRPPRGGRAVLSNGLTVHLLKDATLPVVHLAAFVRTGKICDPADRIGLGEMTAALLKDGGTQNHKADEMDRTLEYLAASLESYLGIEEGRAGLTALKKDLPAVLDIFADMLMRPAFAPEKTELKRAELLELVRRRNDDPARQAVREALRAFYGPAHPYGWRTEEASIAAVTTDDMKAWHANYYRPDNVILAVSGDFGSDEGMLRALEERFCGWKPGDSAFPEIPPVDLPAGRRVFHIQKDVPQASIVVLLKALKRHDPREFRLAVANEMLGGGLSSRLTAEIRSRLGLAYNVYSYFVKKPDYGYTLAYCGTSPGSVGRALSEMLRQFSLMGEKAPPAEETSRAKNALINSFVFRFPTPFDLLTERANYEYYGYAPSYLDDYVSKIAGVAPKDVLAAGRELLRPDAAAVLVVGDARKLDVPLSEFGPVTELSDD